MVLGVPSVLQHCWLGDRKGTWPIKTSVSNPLGYCHGGWWWCAVFRPVLWGCSCKEDWRMRIMGVTG